MSKGDFEKTEKVNPPVLPRGSAKTFTDSEKNAVNSWNEIKINLKSMTSSELQGLSSIIAALPDEARRSAERAISGAIITAEKNDVAQGSQNAKDKLQIEMDARAEAHNKLWNEFKSKEFQDKIAGFDRKDKDREAEIDELLKKTELTDEDIRRSQRDHISPEEMEERKRVSNTISSLYHGATDYVRYHDEQAQSYQRQIDLESKKPASKDRDARMGALATSRDAEYKQRDLYNKQIIELKPEIEKRERKFDKFLERLDAHKEKSEIIKKDVLDHLVEHEQDHDRVFRQNPNSKEVQKRIDVLTKAGMHEKLGELNQKYNLNISDEILKVAEKEFKAQEKRFKAALNKERVRRGVDSEPEVSESNLVAPPRTPTKLKVKKLSEEKTR